MVDLTKNNFGYLDGDTKKPKEDKEEVKEEKKEECKKEDKKCCDVITDFCLPFVCSIEGFKTCVKGFHWESSSYNEHTILDSILDTLNSYQDSIAEVCMGLSKTRIKKSDFCACCCECTNVSGLLDSMEQFLQDMSCKLDCIECPVSNSSIRNLYDDFMSSIYSDIYKLRLLV